MIDKNFYMEKSDIIIFRYFQDNAIAYSYQIEEIVIQIILEANKESMH